MGIVSPFAELIVREHARRRLRGRILTIGRQTINLDQDELMQEFTNARETFTGGR